MTIDSILKPFQHFGVHLSLDRIHRLLEKLDNPHQKVPIIHVAGTNGKGSLCAYLSSVLTTAGYRTGRYTSPHLVDWNERICINEKPITSPELIEIINKVKSVINPAEASPTQFEVITAAAWLYFAQEKVDIAVIEVGLGGRLDATNVCDNPLVTIITSISKEHWQILGPTLADIAREKAGILKPECPAVIGQLPPEAMAVVKQRITELNCPAVFPSSATDLGNNWAEYEDIKYPLPLLGKFQLANSALAIAALKILLRKNWQISKNSIEIGMANTLWPGRLQWITWQNRPLLIDGAHNPAAAEVLREFVDSINIQNNNIDNSYQGISWIIGMLSTKDHADIFRALLRPKDSLYLVPVPDNSTANPEELAILAKTICPELSTITTYPDLLSGLTAANISPEKLTVLCGSLYLLGHFYTLTN